MRVQLLCSHHLCCMTCGSDRFAVCELEGWECFPAVVQLHLHRVRVLGCACLPLWLAECVCVLCTLAECIV
jgi:hypothetical protein